MATEKKKIVTTFYSVLRDVAENEKCPPQARLLIATISRNAVDGKIEREALLTLLRRPPAEGGLTTNQAVERILSFYRPKLVEMGILKEEKILSEIDIEVPDKPAKAEPAAAAAAEASATPASTKPDKVKDVKGKHKAA